MPRLEQRRPHALVRPYEQFLRRLASDARSITRMVASGDLPTRHLGGGVSVITHKLRSFMNGDEDAA
jgi:hypothetical protein